jgi:CheY-like chemotaxis protein
VIVVVDEDERLLVPQLLYVQAFGYVVATYRTADAAFDALRYARKDEVELVLIDVMLAADGSAKHRSGDMRFGRQSKQGGTVGLELLDQLVACNGDVFPERALLLSHATERGVVTAAQAAAAQHGVPFWNTEKELVAEAFAFRVDEYVRGLMSKPEDVGGG